MTMATQTLEVVPNQEEIQNESTQYPMKARDLALSVKDDEGYRAAGEFLIAIKGFRKKVDDAFAPAVQKAHEAHKAIKALQNQAAAPLDEAERIIKPALAAYDQEQDRIRREEQDRLAAEQKKRDDDARIAEAAKVAENGDLDGANAILEAPPAPIVAPPPPPKAAVAGISYRETWKAEVTDMRSLIAAVASGKASTTLLAINGPALNSMVRALRSELKIPGVRVWSEKEVAARSR